MVVTHSHAVTAAICTRGRSPGFERSLRSVLAQTRPVDEIVVVAPVDEQLPELPPGVRVERVSGGVGAARDAALRAATGTVLGFCDDDDEWTDDHVTVLLEAMERARATLVYGDATVVFGEDECWTAEAPWWDFAELVHRGNFVHPSEALLSVTDARAAGGFDESLRAHEDWDLWLRLAPGRTVRRVPEVVARRGWSDSDAGGDDHWDHWERVRQRAVHLPAAAVHDVRDVAPPAGGAADWTARRRLVVCAPVHATHGNAIAARSLLHALRSEGVEARLVPSGLQPTRELEELFGDLADWGPASLYFHPLYRPAVMRSAFRAVVSMWESTRVPPRLVADINDAADLLLVPCAQNAAAFQACGVTVPIRVLHHGIDPAGWPVLDRDRRPVITFGTVGDLGPRKGLDVLVEAFVTEFANDRGVRLLLKSVRPLQDLPSDPRIEHRHGAMSQEELLDTMREMDVFVLPSRGEGFGLTGLEAMATGLPLIATNWSGPADYLDPTDSYPLPYTLVDAAGTRVHESVFEGQWAEPDVLALRKMMRQVADGVDEARQRGLAAAARVHRSWTWRHTARTLRAYLDEALAASGG